MAEPVTMITSQNIDAISVITANAFIQVLSKHSPAAKAMFAEVKNLKSEIIKICKDFFSSYLNQDLTKLSKSAEQSVKFVKTAGPGRNLPVGGGGGSKSGGGSFLTENPKVAENVLGGNWQEVIELLADFIPFGGPVVKLIIKLGLKFLVPRVERAIQQQWLNLDNWRRKYILETMQSFQEKMKPHEFSPSAYKHVLDSKGYKGQELSQGAYDIKTPALQKQIEDEKKKNPDKFKLPYSYLEDKDVQDRKKGKKFQFYNPSKKEESSSEESSSEESSEKNETLQASTSQKFVKVSQNENNKIDQELVRRVEAIKKVLASMNEQKIKQSLFQIVNRNDLSENQKTALFEKQVDAYMRDIKPLQNYMDSLRKI